MCQLENKQTKGSKFYGNIKWELESEKCSKTFFKVLEMQNMQNQTISDLYADDNKSRISNNPQDIVKLVKNYYEKIYTKEAASAASTSK